MPESYRTITQPTQGLYKEKGSKFLAFAFPVASEQEAKAHQAALRKKYHDARHHVYALCVGPDKKLARYSDDGEPSNSSGPPVMGQITSLDLTNILVVVVRYFGGTKLGVPGLINAYRTATSEALSAAEIVEVEVTARIEVRFGYPAMGDIMRIVKENNLTVVSQELTTDCRLVIDVPLRLRDVVTQKLADLRNNTAAEL